MCAGGRLGYFCGKVGSTATQSARLPDVARRSRHAGCGVGSASTIVLAGAAGRLARNKDKCDAPLKDALISQVRRRQGAPHGVSHRTRSVGVVGATCVHRGTQYPASGQLHDMNATGHIGQPGRNQSVPRHCRLNCRQVFVQQRISRSSLLLSFAGLSPARSFLTVHRPWPTRTASPSCQACRRPHPQESCLADPTQPLCIPPSQGKPSQQASVSS